MNTNSKYPDLRTIGLLAALCISLALCSCKAEQSTEISRTGSDQRTQPSVEPSREDHEATNPDADALALLLQGNDRFVQGRLRHGHESAARRQELITEQHPFATVLSCSDSRVPPELLFDQGLGDLFVVRVAGNVTAPDDIGSIEYAVHHLHTRLVIVLGHEGCGAVTAALSPADERSKEPKEIQGLLALILPSLKKIDPKLSKAEQVSEGVEENVRASVQRLQTAPDLKKTIAEGHLKIVGGVYDLESGKVRILN